MAYLSYRYPRHHLRLPAAADTPWQPVGPQDSEAHELEPDGEIDLTTIDLREAQGSVTRF